MHSSVSPEPSTPDPGLVMRRVLILRAGILKALGTPPPDMLAEYKANWSAQDRGAYADDTRKRAAADVRTLQEAGLWRDMTAAERAFMAAAEPEAQQWDDACEQLEGAVCLLWALGHLAMIPAYDELAKTDLLKRLPGAPLGELVAGAKLRPQEEIDAALDAAERWNWRSRTRRLQESGEFDGWLGPKGLSIMDIIKLSAEAAADGLFARPIGDDYPCFGKAYRDLTPEEWSACASIA